MANVLPKVFKGIALFTPGGDLIYGIDPSKQAQWHAHLCHGLKDVMNLADSPYFLVPGYTTTVERWLDPQTNRLETIAEAHPAVGRYIPLLETIFELNRVTWQIAPWQEEYCNRGVIETYRAQFPQLWLRQNLIVRYDPQHLHKSTTEKRSPRFNDQKQIEAADATEGYVLRLYISSSNSSAEKALSNIHKLLEEGLGSPYTLKVIDIAKNPEQAVMQQIVATPTLIRVSPKPVRRIVGQLDDIPRILNLLSSF